MNLILHEIVDELTELNERLIHLDADNQQRMQNFY